MHNFHIITYKRRENRFCNHVVLQAGRITFLTSLSRPEWSVPERIWENLNTTLVAALSRTNQLLSEQFVEDAKEFGDILSHLFKPSVFFSAKNHSWRKVEEFLFKHPRNRRSARCVHVRCFSLWQSFPAGGNASKDENHSGKPGTKYASKDGDHFELEVPKRSEHGDYSTNPKTEYASKNGDHSKLETLWGPSMDIIPQSQKYRYIPRNNDHYTNPDAEYK